MEGEQLIAAGMGSQTGGVNRWGDYSAMTIDPADDCTFWYTQEYILANGSYNWSTRITNFRFPNCGPDSGATAILSPSTLTFPKTVIGQTTSSSVTLSNTGSATLQLLNMVTTGDYAVQANTCGAEVPAGNNCSIMIAFAPTAKGSCKGVLSLTDNAPDNPQSVSLKGTGVTVGISPASFNYGPEPVGQSTAPQAFTITNAGTVTVSLNSFILTGATADYAISSNSCGSSLAAGNSCSLNITFQPTKRGTRNAKLSVSNSGGAALTSALTGVGQ
jgi:hypothetical protein